MDGSHALKLVDPAAPVGVGTGNGLIKEVACQTGAPLQNLNPRLMTGGDEPTFAAPGFGAGYDKKSVLHAEKLDITDAYI